jgi:hypothetical protein
VSLRCDKHQKFDLVVKKQGTVMIRHWLSTREYSTTLHFCD